jgi:hypothetical protein
MSPPINKPSGNARSRQARDLDEPASFRSPVRQHYGGKGYIPGTLFQVQTLTYSHLHKINSTDSIDNNITDAAIPDGDLLLNNHSLIYGSDMQIDPAEEDDRSWHIRSTPPSSHRSYAGQTSNLYKIPPVR